MQVWMGSHMGEPNMSQVYTVVGLVAGLPLPGCL